MRRLMRVSTLARFAAQRDAPETVRSTDARSATHGIRWHEDLAVPAERWPVIGFPWAMIVAVALAAAIVTLLGL